MQKNIIKYFLLANLFIFILAVFFLFYLSNNRLDVPEFSPEVQKAIESKISNPEPKEAGENLTPEMKYTINASSITDWVYFDFSKGAVLNKVDRSSVDWDIGFRRGKIMSNSGESNTAGKGGIFVIKDVEFESVAETPESEYVIDIRKNAIETENPAADKWYIYNYMTHQLKPRKNVYIIRTADGKYAKMQIINYYCEGVAGCYTIKYVYQGNGSRSFK